MSVKVDSVINGTQPQNEICIWLDNYDDIFSDFDPRPFSSRNVSDDFLYELKKVFNDGEAKVAILKLLIPQKSRNSEYESIIINRLKLHFSNTYSIQNKKVKSKKRTGFIMVIAGVLLMTVAGYVSMISSDKFLLHSLVVVMEPASWFLIWTGLENLLVAFKRDRKELNFNKAFIDTQIIFSDLQEHK